ncbi:MAG: polysaccharide biosynthesis/export family protein [Chthoniobacterales bacterium]|jgi:polysaccharide export outer membrane protein
MARSSIRPATHAVFRPLLAALVLLAGGICDLQAQEANYKLSANDLLDFRVFQEPELDGVIRVSGDGTAIFPLIGAVPVVGKTVSQATEEIKARYRDGYLVSPQVSLTVRTYAQKLFTVLGQVQKPGSYDMKGSDEITLLQAIGMAGGYTKIANPGRVTVKRLEEGGRERLIKLDAKRMARGGDSSSFYIKPGDVITVAESLF